jgi:hypothetical protein
MRRRRIRQRRSEGIATNVAKLPELLDIHLARHSLNVMPSRAVKFAQYRNAEPNEEHEQDDLRDHKWWLGLCRRQRFQKGHLFKGLNDGDEAIQI